MTDTSPIVAVSEADLPALAALAAVIWRACYPGIISAEQIEFMLEKMYAPATLRREIREAGIHFYQLRADGHMAGFAAIGPTDAEGVIKLHKLYLAPELHGRGWGSALLKHCESAARGFGARRLILAVNKRNAPAMAAYQRNGFAVADSVVTDIGGGFVMDDFIMAKELTGD